MCLDAQAFVESILEPEGKSELACLDFQRFAGLVQGLKDDVKELKASKAIPNAITISSWVYEVETSKVEETI